MRIQHPLLFATLLIPGLAWGDFTQVNAFWSDNFDFGMPLLDESDVTLQGGDVVQIGYFAGVDPDKDPSTYSPADWASFTPLTGNGSPNADFFPTAIDSSFPGYFNTTAPFDTTRDSGIPNADVRVGIRFFNASAAGDATFINTVSSSEDSWIMKKPDTGTNTPFPASADMDLGHTSGTLVWEGTPFKTDVVPGVAAPALLLTDVSLLNPTTLQVSWSGGDGSNDIETSTNGTTWNPGGSGLSSPALIAVNPGATATLLVRVIEP